jgi:hypothetical protein
MSHSESVTRRTLPAGIHAQCLWRQWKAGGARKQVGCEPFDPLRFVAAAGLEQSSASVASSLGVVPSVLETYLKMLTGPS